MNVSVPDEIIDLISKRISSSKRDLTAALIMMIAYTEIMELPITVEIVDKWLRGSSLMRYIEKKYERKTKILKHINQHKFLLQRRKANVLCND